MSARLYVSKWGDSRVVKIPQEVADELGIFEGRPVELDAESDEIERIKGSTNKTAGGHSTPPAVSAYSEFNSRASASDEVELLELAVDYGIRVEAQPAVEDGGVGSAEVGGVGHVPFG